MRTCPSCGRAIEIINDKYKDHKISKKLGAPKCPKSGKPVEPPWKNG